MVTGKNDNSNSQYYDRSKKKYMNNQTQAQEQHINNYTDYVGSRIF